MVSFIRKAENIDYPEAIRLLAARAGIAVPEDGEADQSARLKLRILEINREAARFFHNTLIGEGGKDALSYLRDRGLTDKTIRRFGLGYSPEGWDVLRKYLTGMGFGEDELLNASIISKGKNGSTYDLFRKRVIFPIIDIRGNVIGFGGRVMGEGGPKYLNSPDTPVFKKSRNLFALNAAKNTKERRLILSEGYMDVISLHQAGFTNAVATLGTSLTSEQSRLISQYGDEVIIAYDSDQAGRQAAKRAIELFDQVGIKVRVLSIKDAKDPDEYIKKFGAQRFGMMLEGSRGAVEYEIERLRQRYDITTDDGRISFLKDFCEMMADYKNPIELDVYISRTAQELFVGREALILQIDSLRHRKEKRQKQAQQRDLRPFTETQPGRPRDHQRAKYFRYAIAEDKLITLLVKNPDYFQHISGQITPEQMVTDTNKAIFTVLYGQLSQNKPIDMSSLAYHLDIEKAARLAEIINTGEMLNDSLQEADDYIRVILEFSEKISEIQLAEMTDKEVADNAKKIGASKKK